MSSPCILICRFLGKAKLSIGGFDNEALISNRWLPVLFSQSTPGQVYVNF